MTFLASYADRLVFLLYAAIIFIPLERIEAPRVFWRLFRLSHATISRVSTVA